MTNQAFSKIWIIVIALVILTGGILTWQYWWVSKEEVKPPEIKVPEEVIEEETANWKTYRNEEYGFEIKYPTDWKVDSSFPGRLRPGQEDFQPGISPQVFSFAPKEIDLTEEASEISIYVAPPGYFTCPPGIPIDCISGQSGEIIVGEIKAMFLEGKSTKYCPPEGREVKEIYLCKSNNYFRFYTTKQKEEIFNQMLSTFRFLE